MLREGVAAALARLMRSLLYEVGPHEVSPHDLPTNGAVAAVLGSVVWGAAFLPAWRASRQDAAVALRAD